MFTKTIALALSAAWLVLLAACGDTNGSSGPSPGPEATAKPTTGAAVPTHSATPASTGQGGEMQITVTDFQVWQDFMPRVGEGGPPLHATVMVAVEGAAGADLTNATGTITITRPGGELIARSSLRRAEGIEDTSTPKTGPRQLLFAMQSTTTTLQLKENESIGGSAEFQLGTARQTVDLPPTTLVFTR